MILSLLHNFACLVQSLTNLHDIENDPSITAIMMFTPLMFSSFKLPERWHKYLAKWPGRPGIVPTEVPSVGSPRGSQRFSCLARTSSWALSRSLPCRQQAEHCSLVYRRTLTDSTRQTLYPMRSVRTWLFNTILKDFSRKKVNCWI